MSELCCAGLKVLELSQGYGALPGMVLSDFGADVVKVEPPGGELGRAMPAFHQWNRGKRGVVLDLDSPEDRTRARSLALSSDVVIENHRPGVLDRLGLGYGTLVGDASRLVYLSVSGFGTEGPYAAYKGYEGIVAAKTGQYLIQNGYRQGPIYDAIFKCSFGASMLGLIGTLAALHARERTGQGQKVESTMVQSNFVYSYLGIRGDRPELMSVLAPTVQSRDPHNSLCGYRIAQCADGQWIQSGSALARVFDNFMRALDIDEYFDDPSFNVGPFHLGPEDNDRLLRLIDAAYATRPLAEWQKRFDEHDAAYATFLTTQQFMDHPQVRHNGHVCTTTDPQLGDMEQIGPLVGGTPWRLPSPAPRLVSGHGSTDMPAPTPPLRHHPAAKAAPASALEGVTILDLAMFAAAPGGPGILADLGARVIKVEPPDGDPIGAGPARGGELFLRVNRGKERVAVDLKSLEGQAVVHRLVEHADVVVHNFRPGVPERLGVDYRTLSRVNDRIVYLYAASFGSSGPDAHRPAFDAVISAMAGGELLQAGRGNPPQQRQTSDHSGLLGVAAAILLGLRARDATGQSQDLETTMVGSAAYLLSDDFIRYAGKAERPLPDQAQHGLHALYRLYPAAEGTWVFLACPQQDEWDRLCQCLDRDELTHDPCFATVESRLRNDDVLAAKLSPILAERSAARWESMLQAADVACVSADGTWGDFLFGAGNAGQPEFTVRFHLPDVGQVEQCGMTVNLSSTPGRVGSTQARGGSSQQVLAELGYDSQAIADYRERRIVAWEGDVES